jgi:hypothetical protein
MKHTTRLAATACAVSGLLLPAAAAAGEGPQVMPTAPTLYYACMSAAGRTEYDSAAFAHANPGPDLKDHSRLNEKMSAAFTQYLQQEFGYNGFVICGTHATLAEAQQWLQGRENESRQPGKNYEYVATDWTYRD